MLGSEQNNDHTKLNMQITIQYQIAETGAGNNNVCAKQMENQMYITLEITHLLKILKLIFPSKLQHSSQSTVFNILMFYDVMSYVLIPNLMCVGMLYTLDQSEGTACVNIRTPQ